MHIEIQVALNFVISYLYNKLPRRRVNIFGEELEKALRDKFQGHWYPEKPFKGSAYRCLKTGDPIDSVLERAARESGVPISDILENLPNELSVWIDPGEVSYRIGEKGAVKILYTENNENHEESSSADREVTKTFNPEAQCFRPIDAVNTTMNNLSLSPKTLLPQAGGSSPQSASSTSPTYKGSPNPTGASVSSSNNSAAYLQRAAQAPLTFTTATFAQTKFGSTKLKTSSKRTNSSSYRMSPTEFSNYIKQRAMQQQLHHGHGVGSGTFGALGAVSPARSISPNPLSLGINQVAAGTNPAADPFYYPNIAMGLYPQFNVNAGQRSLFEGHFNADANLGIFGANNAPVNTKFSSYIEPCYFSNSIAGGNNASSNTALSGNNMQQQLTVTATQQLAQQNPSNMERTNSNDSSYIGESESNTNSNNSNTAEDSAKEAVNAPVTTAAAVSESSGDNSPIGTPTTGVMPNLTAAAAEDTNGANTNTNAASATAATATPSSASNSKLIDGLNSFYGTGSSYQQLLVAN